MRGKRGERKTGEDEERSTLHGDKGAAANGRANVARLAPQPTRATTGAQV